jgi:hypothetical protein
MALTIEHPKKPQNKVPGVFFMAWGRTDGTGPVAGYLLRMPLAPTAPIPGTPRPMTSGTWGLVFENVPTGNYLLVAFETTNPLNVAVGRVVAVPQPRAGKIKTSTLGGMAWYPVTCTSLSSGGGFGAYGGSTGESSISSITLGSGGTPVSGSASPISVGGFWTASFPAPGSGATPGCGYSLQITFGSGATSTTSGICVDAYCTSDGKKPKAARKQKGKTTKATKAAKKRAAVAVKANGAVKSTRRARK